MRTLIIKLGALGDVLRTTPLLRVLEGEVDWVTGPSAVPLLSKRWCNPISYIEGRKLARKKYDLVICLDEDCRAAHLASSVKAETRIGTYLNDQKQVDYTPSSRRWYDMSLISKLGKKKADLLKYQNRDSYQSILFSMLGRKFAGYRYVLPPDLYLDSGGPGSDLVVGLETRAGDRWPTKQWNKFDELIRSEYLLPCEFRIFEQQPTLMDYVMDIWECGTIVTGDTLAMHIAIALEKKVIGIFTCTNPHEIYGYGVLRKIVSSKLKKAFYKTDYVKEAVDCISLKKVETEILKAWKR